MTTNNQSTKPSYLDVIKEYPRRGHLQQFRLSKVATFTCDRCTQEKTAKLVAIKHGDWNTLVCNGCYGLLLSKAAQGMPVSRSVGVSGDGDGGRGRGKGGIRKRKGRSGGKHRFARGNNNSRE